MTAPEAFGPRSRHGTVAVRVGSGAGAVTVGGGAPIVVQSMTNTDTADIEATTRQVAALARAGSEMVRITVDRDEAAAAVPHIRCAHVGSMSRSSATSIISATSCSPSTPPAPKRSTSIASIPAMSASRTNATSSSRRSSRRRSNTARRCGSAPTGARSTRSC